jgi:hypothetical protein
MKRKTVFALVFVLGLSLFLVPVVNAFCIELKYDDGTAEADMNNSPGGQLGVKFSVPNNWQTAKLVKARFYIRNPTSANFEVHVYDLDGNDLVQPFTVSSTLGWFEVPLNVEVSGDFFIAIEYIVSGYPWIGWDLTSMQEGSYIRLSSTDPWIPIPDYPIMIRAEVCPIFPVGGELLLNTVSTIGTWLITGVSTLALSIGIAYKKRRSI